MAQPTVLTGTLRKMSLDQLDPWSQFTQIWDYIGYLAHAREQIHFKCCTCDRWFSSRATHYDVAREPEVWKSSMTQGSNCCAWSYFKDGRWGIHGGYGSTIADMSEFWYLKDFPTESQDPICDYCLLDMIKNGTIMDSQNELEAFPRCKAKQGCAMWENHEGDCSAWVMVKL